MTHAITLENLGTENKNRVNIGRLSLWFSYSTIVAYDDTGDFHCSENVWSKTTGKLLNEICPNKGHREPRDVFERNLVKTLSHYGLVTADN